MMVVFPAPLVPSRAVIWSLWKVRVSSWTATLWSSYSLVTDIRATPGLPPSISPGPFCCESPVWRIHIHHEKISKAGEQGQHYQIICSFGTGPAPGAMASSTAVLTKNHEQEERWQNGLKSLDNKTLTLVIREPLYQ